MNCVSSPVVTAPFNRRHVDIVGASLGKTKGEPLGAKELTDNEMYLVEWDVIEKDLRAVDTVLGAYKYQYDEKIELQLEEAGVNPIFRLVSLRQVSCILVC